MEYLSVEHLVKMVNATVEAFTNIISIMRVNPMIDKILYNSISDILYFLDKLASKLPDVLLSSSKDKLHKHDVQVALGLTIIAWDDFFNDKDSFFQEWEKFSTVWKKFEKSLELMTNTDSSIFLCLN